MTEATHTPGPWLASMGPIEGKPTWTISAKSPRSGHHRVYPIATIDRNPEAEANAAAIAGLPELLAALELARPYVNRALQDERYLTGKWINGVTPALDQIDAVIAAAKPGGPS